MRHKRRRKKKQRTLARTIQLEKYIHDGLEKYRHSSSTRRKHEWFHVDTEKWEKVLINCHNEFKNDTDYPVLKFEEPFYGKYTIEGIEELKITDKRPKYMAQNPVKNSKVRQGSRVKEAPKKYAGNDYI